MICIELILTRAFKHLFSSVSELALTSYITQKDVEATSHMQLYGFFNTKVCFLSYG